MAVALMMKGLSPGVEKAKASASANTLTIKGPATEEAIRKAVEVVGYTFKGKV